MINVLNFGAGVQSTTILLMSCLGELPKLDCAVFSDTGWEMRETYAHLQWCIDEAKKHGIPVHVVSGGNIKTDAENFQILGGSEEGRWGSMPFYTREKMPDKIPVDDEEWFAPIPRADRLGIIRRQCTQEYKIQPVEKFLREMLGIEHGKRVPPRSVCQWFGISADEMRRVRASRNAWSVYHYPLIFADSETMEFAQPQMTRAACEEWLACRYAGLISPPSSCVGCPFHGDDEWLRIKTESPEEWEDACRFDEAIRNMEGMRGQCFLHRSATPLRTVDLSPRAGKEHGPDMFQQFSCGTCNT